MDELNIYVQTHKPHIITITEVTPKHYRHDITDAELSIADYNMTHNLEAIKHGQLGRGNIFYTSNILKASPASQIQDHHFKDSIFTSVDLDKGDKLLVRCVYRSPNLSNDNMQNVS